MKNISKFLTLAFALVFTAQVFAQDIAPLDLKNNMKQAGILFKQISTTINDASKNKDNVAAVAKMIGYFETAKIQSPDSTTAGSLADYQNLIDQEITNLKDLQVALLANDNAAALSVLQKINNVKKEGHDKYK
jgi:ribosomal protein S8